MVDVTEVTQLFGYSGEVEIPAIPHSPTHIIQYRLMFNV